MVASFISENADVTTAAIMLFVGALLLAGLTFDLVGAWRQGVRAWTADAALRKFAAGADTFVVFSGGVQPRVAAASLLISPLSHRACVAWSVAAVPRAMLAPVPAACHLSRSVPFTISGEDGRVVHISSITHLETAPGLGFSRRFTMTEATSVFERNPGDAAAFAALSAALDSQSGGRLPVDVYEIFVPHDGDCTLVAGVLPAPPASHGVAPNSIGRGQAAVVVSIAGARVLIGSPAAARTMMRRTWLRRATRDFLPIWAMIIGLFGGAAWLIAHRSDVEPPAARSR